MIDYHNIGITFILILVYKRIISPCYSSPDVLISVLQHSKPSHLSVVKSLNIESK